MAYAGQVPFLVIWCIQHCQSTSKGIYTIKKILHRQQGPLRTREFIILFVALSQPYPADPRCRVAGSVVHITARASNRLGQCQQSWYYTVSQKTRQFWQAVVKNRLILIVLDKHDSTLSKMICLFNFLCPFTLTYFICLWNSCEGTDAKRNVFSSVNCMLVALLNRAGFVGWWLWKVTVLV